MQVVMSESVKEERYVNPRQGETYTRTMLIGERGSPDNFVFYLLRVHDDVFSPRHTHNFEQVRLVLDGKMDFHDGNLAAGKVGYFPEGTFYGPQTCPKGTQVLMALLQYGGPSGQGFMPQDEIAETVTRMKSRGTFEKGVFSYEENGKKHNVDGYTAIWEARHNREYAPPPARYDKPAFMDPSHFDWCAVAGAPGVHEKALGEFNQRHTAISFLRLDAGCEYSVPGRAVLLATEGRGRMGGESFAKQSAGYVLQHEHARIQAEEPTTLLVISLATLKQPQLRAA